MANVDVIVIGAGIAGASVAALLAEDANVLVIEREVRPGYHTTGRSAALFSETYGSEVVRVLSRASRAYLESHADGMTEHPILTPRGWLYYAPPAQAATLEAFWSEISARDPTVRWIDPCEAAELVPVFRPGQIAAAIYEPRAMDIDVHALHESYLKRLRRSGGTLMRDTPVEAIERETLWRVRTSTGTFSAPIIVNAAGAWADEIAALAGVPTLGLMPKRRTVIIVAAPPTVDCRSWPVAGDIQESIYFKPEAGKLLVSPADETPSPPCDAQPEELDVALAAERLMEATTIAVDRIERKWAGLRSFVRDKVPVIGFEPLAEGFFWLAAQGGYGIQIAHATARCAASLIRQGGLPDDLQRLGLDAAKLGPARLRAAATAQ